MAVRIFVAWIQKDFSIGGEAADLLNAEFPDMKAILADFDCYPADGEAITRRGNS